jgi:periplasmic divalent cation tolerance protein
MSFLFVYVTFPAEFDASAVAQKLVEEKLAACANLIEGMKSFYVWDGKMEQGRESILILKTKSEFYEPLAARLRSLHPAEVPCIVALPIEKGLPDFLSWIDASTK